MKLKQGKIFICGEYGNFVARGYGAGAHTNSRTFNTIAWTTIVVMVALTLALVVTSII